MLMMGEMMPGDVAGVDMMRSGMTGNGMVDQHATPEAGDKAATATPEPEATAEAAAETASVHS